MRKLALISFLLVAALFWGCGQTDLSADFKHNGQLRMEAVYNGGVENGAYNSFRENGIPFFRGFYINGKRANIWEFYDEAGNLAGRQDFDTH